MKIRYHAAARELAGTSEEAVEISKTLDGTELRVLLGERHPALAPYLERMRFACDGELGVEQQFAPDAIVDVLPPVAGGSDSAVRLVEVCDRKLSIDACFNAVRHPGAGGIALFVGVVRDHSDGGGVSRLDYEAHSELALPEARRVLLSVAEAVPGVRLAAMHRYGQLAVGDIAVVVAAAAAHRAEAFEACRLTIDRFKETVPIWKKEWDEQGAPHWVNLESSD